MKTFNPLLIKEWSFIKKQKKFLMIQSFLIVAFLFIPILSRFNLIINNTFLLSLKEIQIIPIIFFALYIAENLLTQSLIVEKEDGMNSFLLSQELDKKKFILAKLILPLGFYILYSVFSCIIYFFLMFDDIVIADFLKFIVIGMFSTIASELLTLFLANFINKREEFSLIAFGLTILIFSAFLIIAHILNFNVFLIIAIIMMCLLFFIEYKVLIKNEVMIKFDDVNG